MTRDEMQEDLNIGDLVNIYIEGSDESIKGIILDFGESGLKLQIPGIGKKKRVIYNRITEYDVEEEAAEVSSPTAPATENIRKSSSEPIYADGNQIPSVSHFSVSRSLTEDSRNYCQPEQEDFDSHQFAPTNETNLYSAVSVSSDSYQAENSTAVISVDRTTIFEQNRFASAEILENEVADQLNSRERQKYWSIRVIRDYAVRENSFHANGKKAKQVISLYQDAATDNEIFYFFLGGIYEELGDLQKAARIYMLSGCWKQVWKAMFTANYPNECIYTNALVILSKVEDDLKEPVLAWICKNAVENENVVLIRYLAENYTTFQGKILLYWYANSPVLMQIPDRQNLLSESNIEYFLRTLPAKESDVGRLRLSVQEETVRIQGEAKPKKSKNAKRLEGYIQFYNTSNQYGTIRNLSGGKISFKITAFDNTQDREFIEKEYCVGQKVSYISPSNTSGAKYASNIILLNEWTVIADKEKQALEMIIPEGAKNPFENMVMIYSSQNYAETARRCLEGTKGKSPEKIHDELDQAEKNLIKAIRANNNLKNSILTLVEVYIKFGDEDHIIKGIQLLETFKYMIPTLNLDVSRIQITGKSGNYVKAFRLFLEIAILRSEKKTTKFGYINQLAVSYYRSEEWQKALELFERLIHYIDTSADAAKFETLREPSLRSAAIASFKMGDFELAQKYAKSFLKKYNGDSVIQQIAEGTYETASSSETPGQTVLMPSVKSTLYSGSEHDKNQNTSATNSSQQNTDEEERLPGSPSGPDKLQDFLSIYEADLQYEMDYSEEESLLEEELILAEDQLSDYLNDKLLAVNLTSTFNKVDTIYNKLEDGHYTGDYNDAKKAIDLIQNRILRNRSLNAESRSIFYLGMARLVYDSRINSDSKSKYSFREVKKNAARYASYAADARVENYASIDSIRFLYIEALRNFPASSRRGKENPVIIAAMNMLVATFFTEEVHLIEELHMSRKESNSDYYGKPCVSVKDFLIMTFMLNEKQKYVKDILKGAAKEKNLRTEMIQCLNVINNDSAVDMNDYELDEAWKRARDIYDSVMQQLRAEINTSVHEYDLGESLRQRISKIQELMNRDMLWNQDEKNLRDFLDILTDACDTYEKYSTGEKIEGFRSVLQSIENLQIEIRNSPTELGYDYIYKNLKELDRVMLESLNEMYLSSRPDCRIELSTDSVYIDQNAVNVGISFYNAPNRQDADAVDIALEGSPGTAFLRCENNFTVVRSGETQEYRAVFSLDEAVILNGQFEITISMKYRYRSSVYEIEKREISEILPVNITDRENYVPVVNKYDRIIRGSGVQSKELFKGRDELIESICTSLYTPSSGILKNRGIILWGQRRVGKNSVKDYLKEKILTEHPHAYIIIELGSIGKCRTLREFLVTIINTTEDTLMEDYEEIYNQLLNTGLVFPGEQMEETESYMTLFSRFMRQFSTRLQRLSEPDTNIPLFFIDEFSYLYEWIEKKEIDGIEFMRFWKSFIQDYDICAIIIAQDNIPVWRAQYENEFACMNYDNEITYLDFKGAQSLICDPCKRYNKVLFDDDAVQLIYDWTKGSAYLIVIFCKYIIDYLNANYMDKATKTIVRLVFEKEFMDKKGMFESGDFEPQIQDVANVGDEAEEINHLNEQLLKEIAAATIKSPSVRKEDLIFLRSYEEGTRILERLKERKIIDVEDNQYCSINMPLLKLYLLRSQGRLTKEILNHMVR